ncbi:unnamed protein product [Closterium sp. NIES-64]|nr:unnamed protein product [Closterium sp. NIES-64]
MNAFPILQERDEEQHVATAGGRRIILLVLERAEEERRQHLERNGEVPRGELSLSPQKERDSELTASKGVTEWFGSADATTPTASTPASVAAPVRAPAPQRRRRTAVDLAASWRLGVIDLDDIVARVQNGNTPLGADDDTLAYFDGGEIDCHGEDGADDDADAATPIDKKGWEPAEVMQLAWIRHDFDEQYQNLCRLQGQNRDVMLYEQVRLRHPGWRHGLAATKAKVFRMEAQWRNVSDLLLKPSGKGKPPKMPIFYDIFDRFLGDRAICASPGARGPLDSRNYYRASS